MGTLSRNLALETIRAGDIALGFGLFHLKTVAAPILALASGYQWLSIDMEHGSFTASEVAEICVSALSVGITPIVRIANGALDEAARALDNGAQGIVIPVVESADQARSIVQALRFAPIGRRGWGGGGARYGFAPPSPGIGMAELNAQTLVIPMIETARGVEQADAIAAVDGVDALFVGLADLSIGLGVPGRFDAPEVVDAFSIVAAACERHRRVLGMGGVYDDVIAPRFMQLGARLVAGGNDQGFLLSAATARAGLLRRLAGGAGARQTDSAR